MASAEPGSCGAVRIGNLLPSRKHGLAKYAVESGAPVVNLDLDRDLDAQGPFDVVVQKLTDELVAASLGDTKADTRLRRFEEWVRRHPQVIVVEPLSSVRLVIDRLTFGTVLQQLRLPPGIRYRPARFAEKRSVSDALTDVMHAAGLRFPVLCKTATACGTKASHELVLVFGPTHATDADGLPHPLIVQEYINHSATLLKVYVLGSQVWLSRRPSMPDFPATPAIAERASIRFAGKPPFPDPPRVAVPRAPVSRSVLVPPVEGRTAERVQFTDLGAEHVLPDLPVRELDIAAIAVAIREAFRMRVFGFDALLESESGQISVVDVNFFPSFTEVPNFDKILVDYISALARQRPASKL